MVGVTVTGVGERGNLNRPSCEKLWKYQGNLYGGKLIFPGFRGVGGLDLRRRGKERVQDA